MIKPAGLVLHQTSYALSILAKDPWQKYRGTELQCKEEQVSFFNCLTSSAYRYAQANRCYLLRVSAIKAKFAG